MGSSFGAVGIEQRARRAGHDGERRPQIVRHGAQERVAELLGLHPELRAARFIRELEALDRGADESRERLEELALVRIAQT